MAGVATSSRQRSKIAPYLMILPGLAYLAVFFVVPLFSLARTSLSSSGGSVYLPTLNFDWNFGNFGKAFVDGTVAAHFTGREVAQTHSVPERHMTRDGATHANLDVVGMRTEEQQIDRVRVHSHESGPLTGVTTRTRREPDR